MNEEDIQIDRFLAGEMEETEASAFAEQVRANGQLRQKVRLRHELTSYLSSGELELVDLLEKVDEAEDKKSPPAVTSRRWWLLLVLIPLGLLLWQQLGNQADQSAPIVEAPTAPPSTKELITSTPQDTLEEAKDEASDTDIAPPPAAAPAAAPPARPLEQEEQPSSIEPPKDTETNTPDTLVYASLDPADFAPNPYLEDIVTTGLRAEEDVFLLSIITEKDTVRRTEDPVLSITTKADRVPEVALLIYNNSAERFLEELPIQRLLLTSWEELDGQKTSRINLAEIPRPGRYYLLLVDNEGEFLAGKRLLVR